MGYQDNLNRILEEALKEAIAEAVKKGRLPDISKEPKPTIRQMVYLNISNERKYHYAFINGFEIGFTETYKKATHEKYVNMAKNMLRDPKIKIETVIEETGLERDEIMELKAELED
jgi:hypothetical protein